VTGAGEEGPEIAPLLRSTPLETVRSTSLRPVVTFDPGIRAGRTRNVGHEKEVSMDIETKHELDRLRRSFEEALLEVRLAPSDEEAFAAWRKVQTASWELNALLPTRSP
jgi:hypothetical protein